MWQSKPGWRGEVQSLEEVGVCVCVCVCVWGGGGGLSLWCKVLYTAQKNTFSLFTAVTEVYTYIHVILYVICCTYCKKKNIYKVSLPRLGHKFLVGLCPNLLQCVDVCDV